MTFPFYDYDSDFFTTEDLLFLAGASGKAVEDTATGNPVTFLTDLAKPLKSLLIPFTPVQSGTGDPSPDNIRSIVPWDGLTVYNSGADTSNPTETDVVFPSPVYGGEYEVVSGKLTVKRVGIFKKWKDGTNPAVGTSYTRKTFNFDVSVKDVSTYAYQRCNVAPQDWSTDAKTHFYIDENKAYLWLPTDTDGELEVQFVAVLVTPQEIQLTPQQINAIKGDNTIWSDANGECEVTYLKKG